jgi:hypothetical protein
VQGSCQFFKKAGKVEAPPRHGRHGNSGAVRAANAAGRCRSIQVQSKKLTLLCALLVQLVILIHAFSAAILASPIVDGEPVSKPVTSVCEDGAAVGDFYPKKRERSHALWFDVPTRGGIGMIHVAKRNCPEIMFLYLDHISKAEGREGWSCKPNDALLSPTKVRGFLFLPLVAARWPCSQLLHDEFPQPRHHHERSGKTLNNFPPSPSDALFSGLSPRALRPGRDSWRTPAASDWPPSPSNPLPANSVSCSGSSPRGYAPVVPIAASLGCRVEFVILALILCSPFFSCSFMFGSADKSSARAASPSTFQHHARHSDGGGGSEVIVYPKGTKIIVLRGKFAGYSGEIVNYSNVGWYTASLKGLRGEASKVRVSEFRIV